MAINHQPWQLRKWNFPEDGSWLFRGGYMIWWTENSRPKLQAPRISNGKTHWFYSSVTSKLAALSLGTPVTSRSICKLWHAHRNLSLESTLKTARKLCVVGSWKWRIRTRMHFYIYRSYFSYLAFILQRYSLPRSCHCAYPFKSVKERLAPYRVLYTCSTQFYAF